MSAPTAEAARAAFAYDARSGEMTRRTGPRAGKPATFRTNGYLYVSLDGRDYPAARIAWLIERGELPPAALRFLDENPLNLAFANFSLSGPSVALESRSASDAEARVLELLEFDEETGVFFALRDRFEWKAGQVVGTVSPEGYLLIGLDGDQHLAHRLAWLVMHGKWPDGVIDHWDGDGLNNRPNNLRDVTQRVNVENRRGARSDNVSGVLGAHFRADTGRFASKIKVGGRIVRLGSFATAQEAHEAYVTEKRRLHEGNTL